MARRSRQGGAAPAAWCAMLAAALAVAGSALADPQNDKTAKASSLAPHTRSHVYGTPVSKPILHKRKKRKPPAAAAPVEPIK